jgi:hypothetical protein
MMDGRKYAFLKAVLGTDGASSLKKAADKYEDLEGAIVPRAIMAWLGVVSRGDYEGGLPGVDDSYLDFSKNEDATYSGSIAIGEGIFPFQNANVFHLAAGVALSLGASLEQENIKDVDVVRLGKSIDILVKAKYLSGTEMAKALPGPPNKPEVRGTPAPPMAPTKQVEKVKPPANQLPAKAPKQAKLPKHKIPKLRVKMPSTSAKKSFELPTEALKSECNECGQVLVKNEKFVGCLCFKDMARHVTLSKHDNRYAIGFGSGVDEDGMAAILDALGVNHG